MDHTILTCIIIPILIIAGANGIYSFYKNDQKEHFNKVNDPQADRLFVAKTVGRKNHIRFQNLFWGIVLVFVGIGVLISVLNR